LGREPKEEEEVVSGRAYLEKRNHIHFFTETVE